MIDRSKRSVLALAGLASLWSCVALVGCGKKEEPPAAAAPASEAASVAATPASAAEPLKAAWVYVGPVGDGGWTFAHDLGRKAVEAEFGDKVKTSFVEKVPEGADAERVIRDLASQGNKIIFATSFGFMESMLKVAAEFPDVKFEHATGYKRADNMGIYDAKFYEDAYQAGIIAGAMTKSNTLGFVASFPIPEVLRNINGFTLGAQSINPKVKTKVVWVNSWFDPPKESEAAQSLINAGADVLLQNTDSPAVLQTAEKNGKYAFGWDSDMSDKAPKAHLASCIANWGPYYKKAVKDVLDGTWKAERTVWGVKEGQNELVKIADIVPAEAKAKVAEVMGKMKTGEFEVFTGPLVDSAGTERLAKDMKADQDWKDKVDFYVKGVEGKIPSGK
jgi:basic membrane protein A and related proteins